MTVSNQNLKVAEARFRQARAMIRFNRSAEFPTISTSPSITNERYSPQPALLPAVLANNGTGDFTLPFDFSYEVDLWGRVRRTVSASREEAQATAADLQTASLSLHAELAVDYFELRSADAQKQLLDDTVKAYTDALNLTQNRFNGGAAPKSDVAQAQTQLDGAQVQDTDVTVMRAQYEHAIATLIGKPPAQFSMRLRRKRSSATAGHPGRAACESARAPARHRRRRAPRRRSERSDRHRPRCVLSIPGPWRRRRI